MGGSVVGVGESGVEFVEVGGAVAVEGRGRKQGLRTMSKSHTPTEKQ